MGALAGQHALITGGGTGIGAAIARALADEGAAVSIAGRRQGAAASRRREPAESDTPSSPTSPSANDCDAMVLAARKAHGPIDIRHCQCRRGRKRAVQESRCPRTGSRMIDVNLTGAFLTVQGRARRRHAQMRNGAPHRLHRLDRGAQRLSLCRRLLSPPSTVSSGLARALGVELREARVSR